MKNILISMKQLLNKVIHNQRGEISNIIPTLIGGFLLIGGLTGITVYSLAGKTDEIAQNIYDTANADFVSEAVTERKVKPSAVQALQQTLDSTGILAEITIKIEHMDENEGRKAVITSGDMAGENQSFITYYNAEDIKEDIELKKGDKLISEIKSISPSYSQPIRKVLFKVTGKGVSELVSSSQGLVV